MASTEQLIFDIITRDRASEGFRKVGEAAKAAAGDTETLNRRLDEAGKKSATARVALAGDKEAQAALDKMDAKLVSLNRRTANPNISIEGAARAIAEVSSLELELDKLGSTGGPADKATASLGKLAGSGGGGLAAIPGGGMGALIGAAGILSPTLVTLGFGLAGFGAAAIGVVKPIENAAQKTGGLQKNMHLLNPEQQAVARGLLGLGREYDQFQKSLQPEVFKVFNSGLHLAGNLLHDVQPVAKATGTALEGLLGRVDQEFQSGTWQNFFGWMARQAGPDVKLVGDAFIHLMDTIPPLMQDLQPLATGLLHVVDQAIVGADKVSVLAGDFEHLGSAATSLGQKTSGSNSPFQFLDNSHLLNDVKFVNDLLPRFFQHAAEGAAGTKLPMDAFFQNTQKAGKATQSLAWQQQSEAAAAKAQAAEIAKLNAQITTHIAKVLTLEGDEVTWKQAQQAATQAIGQNSHALDGNSKSALAARSSIIQATTQVIKFADDSDTSTSALHRASGALQDQIGWLERHAGKSKIARQEIALLIQEETKIKREIDQKVNIDGRGRWSVAGSGSPGGLGHRVGATGGRVPGFGGGDVHPYLLEGGEAIVPKHLTPAVAPFLAAQGVPGFAAGGIIPSYGGGLGGLSPWVQHNMTATDSSVTGSIAGALAHALQTELSGLGSVAPASGSALAAQNYARSLLSMYGWSQGQMSSLIPLWNQESGWSANAVNPSSGAYGIPQALPSVWGHPYALGDYKNQVIWGLNYIRSRYGSPGGAEAHELSAGWYDRGGYLPPGLSLAYNGTGKPEPVGGAGATYNIHITLPAGSDRESGRRIVEAIRKYEQGSGKSWRS